MNLMRLGAIVLAGMSAVAAPPAVAAAPTRPQYHTTRLDPGSDANWSDHAAGISDDGLAAAQVSNPQIRAAVVTELNARPIVFEPNHGQADPAVRFLARGGAGTLFLTEGEMVLMVPGASGALEPLRSRLEGGASEVCVGGRDEQSGRVNIYRGKDPSRWKTGLPTYGAVAYEGVYPGVDLVYHGRDGQLEYDFVVAPGADPSQLHLSFAGAEELELAESGDLVLRLPTATVVQKAPVVYQVVDGGRRMVEGRFVVEGPAAVGFALGPYDTSRELVIDPVMGYGYSTYVGGSGGEGAFTNGSLSVDSFGHVYLVGHTGSVDYPVTGGAYDPEDNGGNEVAVTKLGADGASLIYSTYLGGSAHDIGYSVALGGDGTAYVGGYTLSSDFPTTAGAYDSDFNGVQDGFVAALTPSGGALVYATYLGTSGIDVIQSLTADSAGNIFAVGRTDSAAFPTTPGAYDRSHNGGQDGFLVKLNPEGTALLFSTFLGGTANEWCNSVAVPASGNAYVTGVTGSRNFPTTAGAFDRGFSGLGDAFVTKFTSDGSGLIYSTYLGGNGRQGSADSFDIAVDTAGSAFVVGYTTSPNFPTTPGAFDRTFNGFYDGFVTKFNPAGSALAYSTFVGGGGNSSEKLRSIVLTATGEAWVSGETSSADFPTSADALDSTNNGNVNGLDDAVMCKLSANGSSLVYSSYLGGTLDDESLGIDISGSSVFVSGYTKSADFPTTAGAFDTTLGGGSDFFVTRVDFP